MGLAAQPPNVPVVPPSERVAAKPAIREYDPHVGYPPSTKQWYTLGGGTRTASISGACVALFEAIRNSHDDQRAIKEHVAAVSIGLKDGRPLLDLDYEEDSSADTDLNVVMTESGGIIEIQGTAEKYPFTKNELDEMIESASNGIADIVSFQKSCLS